MDTNWLDIMPPLPSDGSGPPLCRGARGAVVDLDEHLGFAWALRWLTMWQDRAPFSACLRTTEHPPVRGTALLERWAGGRTTAEDKVELARACSAAVARSATP